VRLPGLVVTAAVLACAFVAPVRADPKGGHRPTDAPKKGDSDAPWAKGVSQQRQDQAIALFGKGNDMLGQERYTDALPLYLQALKLWDHPSIRYNMALCLIHMLQPLEAYDNLTQAMRYGEAPLGPGLFKQAKDFQSALQSSLAQIAVTVIQPDVKVTLDGKPITADQGTTTISTLAGPHQLVATKPGFETEQRSLNLPAGKVTREEVTLKEAGKDRIVTIRENYERRWSWWFPWSVAGGGVLLGLVGGGVYLDARHKINNYDAALARDCPAGCTSDMIGSSLSQEARTARRLSQVAIGMWVVAGAAIVTGGALSVINRPQKMEEHKVTPMMTVSKDQVSLGVSFVLP